ncbi:MAG: hypothetical protein ACYTEX_04330 [Planctomycetota bacterium]
MAFFGRICYAGAAIVRQARLSAECIHGDGEEPLFRGTLHQYLEDEWAEHTVGAVYFDVPCGSQLRLCASGSILGGTGSHHGSRHFGRKAADAFLFRQSDRLPPPIPPTGDCRSNIEMTINEVDDVCDVKGMHQTIFYGSCAKQLRAFRQLYGIDVVT